MKVIIDIPKKEYDIIKSYKSFMSWTEGLIKKGVAIPEGATNGDIIKAMFPNIESRLDENTGIMLVKWVDGTTKTFKESWWNAPYKGVEE